MRCREKGALSQAHSEEATNEKKRKKGWVRLRIAHLAHAV